MPRHINDILGRFKSFRLRWSTPHLMLALAVMTACSGGGYNGGGGGGGGTAPSAPANLALTAGEQQATLSWSASSGATSYHVKRSTTSGGPYTQAGAPVATNFTDTGLTDGTTYYYVVSGLNSYGEGPNSAEKSVTPMLSPPAPPTSLVAIPGDTQIALSWNASSGAMTYNVKQSLTHGGPYSAIAAGLTATSFTATGLNDGTPYFYVVTAVNTAGESANSSEATATPVGNSTSIGVTADIAIDRHAISPYIYGGSYPKDGPTITDSGLSVVRWGGNAASTYNWQQKTYNADNDYFFEDFDAGEIGTSDSAQFITDVKAAGSNPLMSMVMLPWVAKSAENSGNHHWSFSVAKYGAQCAVDPFNSDAGNGVKADCVTNLTADPNDAYDPLLDTTATSCPSGKTCHYRDAWTAALSAAFGSAPHFYDMDNEIDIWGGTHRDIHPANTTYQELRDIYLSESRALKGWDPAAIRLGPVSCCWFFYWRSATGAGDTSSHGGVDFLPWWINEVAWSDAVAGTRSLDMFDIHAYPDGPDTSSFTQAQKQALAVRVYRDWWDSTYTSEASYIVGGGFSNEPLDSKPFRIPRMRAIVNATYPGTQFAITEWSAEFAGASDFSTALGDADAYGILGREHVDLASRWVAPDPANPNYLALKLYTNYDGSHHGFQPISVSTTNDGDPNLFSSYGSVSADGKTMTLMIVNKDPARTAHVTFNLPNSVPSSVVSYTLAVSNPTTITTASSGWSTTRNFPPYSATLLVITGSANLPSSEWELNPDAIMVAAGGSVTVHPHITSGTTNVTIINAMGDPSLTVADDQPLITPTQDGAVTITAGATPGFYHFFVTGADGGSGPPVTQNGWLVVGKAAATLTKTGDNQTGGSLTLTATLAPGSSGGTPTGASIFFTTSVGTLSQRIVPTDSNGKATVILTLPSGSGQAHVTAEGPYGLGHPVVTFTETSN